MASHLYKVTNGVKKQYNDYKKRDRWNIARDTKGALNTEIMKKHFKYISTGHTIPEWRRIRTLLTENIKSDPTTDLNPYITLGENVYFLNEEDYHLINGLLYITPLKSEK
jgi:hypothetical protein